MTPEEALAQFDPDHWVLREGNINSHLHLPDPEHPELPKCDRPAGDRDPENWRTEVQWSTFDRDVCRYCTGEATPGGDGGSRDHYNALVDADPDDLRADGGDRRAE
jgi:hypothetical protein